MDLYHAVVISAESLPWMVPSALQGFSSSSSPAASPSPSPSQRPRRKHLAFSHYHAHGFSSSSSTQHATRIHLPTTFSDHHDHLSFDSAELQHQQPRGRRTRVSIGRYSGAIHGSNSRKGRPRKRPDIVKQDNNEELESLHGKKIGDEFLSEDADSHMFCDDVPYDKNSYEPYDKDSGSHMFSDDVPYDALCVDENPRTDLTGSLPSSTHVYDSIHGDFWQNDPYYQEFETLDSEIVKKKQVLDGSTRGFVQPADRSNDVSVAGERSLIERECVDTLVDGSSRHDAYLVAVDGGNGAAIAHEHSDISESRSVPPTTTEGRGSASPPFIETFKCNEEPFPSHSAKQRRVQDFVGVLERDQQCGLDSQKSSSQQDNGGKDLVREVGSAERPSASLGSVQCVDATYVESRQCSANGEEDGKGFECRSATESTLAGVDGSFVDLNSINMGASIDGANIAEESGSLVTEISAPADGSALEQVSQVVEQVAETISDSIKEQVGSVVDEVKEQVGNVVDEVEKQVSQVAEQVTQTADQIVEQVTNLLSNDEIDEESDDEFEAYTSLDIPEFKGRQGLSNFTVLQEQQGIISVIYDFYIFMLKRSFFEFILGMFAAPILLSFIFTILYLPEFNGLALDETVREFQQSSDLDAKAGLSGLQLSWETVFQVFMFSVSLSTGLQPELSPLSPYTLVVANLNALVAQLIFVFLSGAVFARLSQPSQPVKCSTVAIICPPPSNRRLRKEACHKALLTRYVLAGPQPCELVDVKVDLTYHYNTVTRSGTYFRTSQSLKLVRPEIAFLDHGMLVRHIIDETSPLYQRTQGMLEKEDAVFSLSVVGLERSSMQSVFHVQHYCVYDKDVVWDAEFVDMILISKKNRRVVDHSLLSTWKLVVPR